MAEKRTDCFHDGVSINGTIKETYGSIKTASWLQTGLIAASWCRRGNCGESILVSCPIDYGTIMWSSSGVRIVSGFVKYFGDDIVKYFDDIKEKTTPLFGGAIKEN